MWLGVSSRLYSSSPTILVHEKRSWFVLDVKLVLMLWKKEISVPVLGN
jgi:hypothetical protein